MARVASRRWTRWGGEGDASTGAARESHLTRRGGTGLTGPAGRRLGSVSRWRRALVVDGELRWVLQHEGGTGSEEGPMVEDYDGQRWELTVRG
jgi:hypothetical protein